MASLLVACVVLVPASPYDSVLFSYPKENGCRIFSHLCRNAVFRSTSPPGIFPSTLPLFFLFMKSFSLRVRTTPQTFHSELYAEGLACLLAVMRTFILAVVLFFFFPLQFPHSIIENIPTYATLHGIYLPSHRSDGTWGVV